MLRSVLMKSAPLKYMSCGGTLLTPRGATMAARFCTFDTYPFRYVIASSFPHMCST